MKTSIFKKIVIGTILLGGLTACGDDPQLQNLPYGYGNGQGFCAVPTGNGTMIKDRTVIGNFGSGAALKLDIYSDQSGSIAAMGELVVPSIESLFGFNGGTFGNIGGVGYTGPNSLVRTCVSSQNAIGNLERDAAYQEIDLALYGDNVYIEMGNTIGPITAYLVGDAIEGTVLLQYGAFGSRTFNLSR